MGNRIKRKPKPVKHYFGEVRDLAKSVLDHKNDWLPKNMPNKKINNRTSSAFVNFLPRQQIVTLATKMYDDQKGDSDYNQAPLVI